MPSNDCTLKHNRSVFPIAKTYDIRTLMKIMHPLKVIFAYENYHHVLDGITQICNKIS